MGGNAQIDLSPSAIDKTGGQSGRRNYFGQENLTVGQGREGMSLLN